MSDKKPSAAKLGDRFNKGKLKLELVPHSWTIALAQVFSQGARKYADDNWKKGLSMRECVGCLLRHLNHVLRGEWYDRETGCHHLAHVAWNALAIMWMHITGKGVHDLPDDGELLPTMLAPVEGVIFEKDKAEGQPTYYFIGVVKKAA